ncbi:hypothetical protein C1H46_037947 [Malus baccata]|uniref:Protein BCCIP homolog n=1 Tax=Malus baccata TaxID=106549 RepID=A0A540KRB2_MALBA|nr:hypothetical protein C1H46_037947 [Malus baccata]
MPRKPARHCRYQPLTFSPFARHIAHVASSFMDNRRRHSTDLPENTPPNSTGNGWIKKPSEIKKEQSTSSDEEEFDGTVQADFAFFDPKPDDFHGVKTLLQTYLDDKEWDLSGFADLILEQTTVGTVVKIEDDEDNGIFALATALNLERYKGHKCVTEVKEFLLKVCQEKDVKDDLRSLLGREAKSVGLLVSQRVTNLPPQLLPPLYDALFDEVSWATEDEPTEELQNFFRFKVYIIVSKVYKLRNPHQKKGVSVSEEPIIYIKPEDEIFHELSAWSFEFPLHTEQPTLELRNYQQMGLVMAVKADQIPTFRQQIKSLVDES